jgi:hypothetical protein
LVVEQQLTKGGGVAPGAVLFIEGVPDLADYLGAGVVVEPA